MQDLMRPKHHIDINPTRVDNPVVTDVDLKQFAAELRARGISPDTSVYPLPEEVSGYTPRYSVTEVEVAALRGVDIAEQVTEPLNRFNAARAGIKLCAWVARKLR